MIKTIRKMISVLDDSDPASFNDISPEAMQQAEDALAIKLMTARHDHLNEIAKPAEPARSVVGGAVFKFSSLFTALGERQRELTDQIKRLTEELRQVEAAQKAAGTALTALSEDAALTDEERARALAPMEMSLVDSLGRFNEADI